MGRQTNTVGNSGDDRDFAGIRSFRPGSHGTACCGGFRLFGDALIRRDFSIAFLG